jgi:hypothetical protein
VKVHWKCTLEGKSSEFVSIEIKHEVEKGVLELILCFTQNLSVKRLGRFIFSIGTYNIANLTSKY